MALGFYPDLVNYLLLPLQLVGIDLRKMAKFRKHLSEPWFSLVLNGNKTVEGRLNGGDFREIVEGDIIQFYNNDSGEERTYLVEVQGKRIYDTFRKFLENELPQALPGVESVDLGVKVYYQFYSPSAESKYGVVSIEVKVVSSNREI